MDLYKSALRLTYGYSTSVMARTSWAMTVGARVGSNADWYQTLLEEQPLVAGRRVVQHTEQGKSQPFIERPGLEAECFDLNADAASNACLGFRPRDQRRTDPLPSHRFWNE